VLVALNAELDTGIAMNLMLGDCLERMKEIPDGSVDMILADPPYGTTACKWDSVIDLALMWEQLKRIIKPNGAIVLFGSQPFTSVLVCSNLKMFKYDVYWKKEKPTNIFQVKRRFGKSTEVISIFYKEQPTYNPQMVKHTGKLVTNKPKGIHKSIVMGNSRQKVAAYIDNGFRYPTDVLEFRREILGSTVHPTQKPVALMEYLIKTYTNEGETVLDFVMGSGTSGIAAKNTGRKFIGIEKDAGYFEIARQRIGV
jgi:site-specific DNA-methyltransferase (adenine-specific)